MLCTLLGLRIDVLGCMGGRGGRAESTLVSVPSPAPFPMPSSNLNPNQSPTGVVGTVVIIVIIVDGYGGEMMTCRMFHDGFS